MTAAATAETLALRRAYATCRAIAKREAKNFYYAFVALPRARRNAICAVYAFMRKADDLSDDESLTREERHRRLDAWLALWRQSLGGGPAAEPVFLALGDAMQRFTIPASLLEELVAGVTRDLQPTTAGVPDTYSTFAELYQYCYGVASVVGLVCIRIFGYQDPRAEKLAEETGVAFQLTNILRDVAEDAERRRVYLPLEDLRRHDVTVEGLIHRGHGLPATDAERALLREIGGRADAYYRSAQALLPMIAPESRPALWVMVSIYHRLLKRIQQADYDVFSDRASVPLAQKLGILGVGQARMVMARLRV